MTDEHLHTLARSFAETLKNSDRKQLRFNEIVACAKTFYPEDMVGGLRELVNACDRAQADLYVKGAPMWMSLQQDYGWMLK